MRSTAAMALAITAVVALDLAAVPAGAVTPWRVFKTARASGDFATTVVAGNVNRPAQLGVRVLARPNQAVTAHWTMVCSKGFSAGSKSGRFSGRTPITRAARFPMTRPSRCTLSAGAQLNRGGRLTVQLLRR
jgi:hypothetical protein